MSSGNQHALNTKYDMLEHTQSKYIHNCVITRKHKLLFGIWLQEGKMIVVFVVHRWDIIEAKAACLLLSAMHSAGPAGSVHLLLLSLVG